MGLEIDGVRDAVGYMEEEFEWGYEDPIMYVYKWQLRIKDLSTIWFDIVKSEEPSLADPLYTLFSPL